MNALDDYKRKSGRMFPTCSEVLEVINSLGYVKLIGRGDECRHTRSGCLGEADGECHADMGRLRIGCNVRRGGRERVEDENG